MRLRLISLAIVLGLGVLAVIAWQRNTARAPADAPSETQAPGQASMPVEPSEEAKDPGVQWDTPHRWVTELAQGMRLASYSIPAPNADQQPGLCAVYYFGPGGGGGVEANVERWVGEFQDHSAPVRRTRTIHGLKVSEVDVAGTYAAHAMAQGQGSETQPGWRLLGAIVEGPNGAVFFKLTGPGPTVSAAAGEFEKLLTSLRTK